MHERRCFKRNARRKTVDRREQILEHEKESRLGSQIEDGVNDAFITPEVFNEVEETTDSNDMNIVHELASLLYKASERCGQNDVNQIISFIRNEKFDVSKFKEEISNVKDCRRIQIEMEQDGVVYEGFEKQEITTETHGTRGNIYGKDVVTVLQRQVAALSDVDLVTTCSLEGTKLLNHICRTSHSSLIERAARRNAVMDPDPMKSWNEDNSSRPNSFVGLIQVYSDKACTTLKQSSVTSYPLHVTLLNATSSARDRLIRDGLTVVGFLPVEMNANRSKKAGLQDIEETSSASFKAQRIELVSKSCCVLLKKLESHVPGGFPVTTASGSTFTCHPVLTSYCCDLPEAKMMSATKSSMSIEMPCHRCTASSGDMEKGRVGTARSITIFKEVHARYDRDMELAKNFRAEGNHEQSRNFKARALQELKSWSLHPWITFLHETPLIPENMPFDVFSIFTYEPLHNLNLGISKLLKLCTYNLLGSSESFTSEDSAAGGNRSFVSVRHSVLSGTNSVLRAIEKDDLDFTYHVDFSSDSLPSSLNGIYTDEGLRGMLEGKDYRNLDYVFPFVGAYLDRWVGDASFPSFSSLFSTYSDILSIVESKKVEWNSESTSILEGKIKSFKKLVLRKFGGRCTTGLHTLKFHLLDHLAEDLGRFGSLSILSASQYEYAHTIFKRHYLRTSRRRHSALDETIRRVGDSISMRHLSHSGMERVLPENETPRLLGRGRVCLVLDLIVSNAIISKWVGEAPSLALEELTDPLHSPELPENVRRDVGPLVYEIYKQVGHLGLGRLVSLLSEEMEGTLKSEASNSREILIHDTAYIQGGLVPNIDNYSSRSKTLYAPLDTSRLQQRIYATNCFNGHRRFSTVLIESDKDGRRIIWVGRVLCLISLREGGAKGTQKPYAFIQFMDYTKPADSFDSSLRCVIVRWSTQDETDHSLHQPSGTGRSNIVHAAPWFGLIPLESVSGKIPIVRSNYNVHPFSVAKAWIYHRFYINRFYKYDDYD